MAHAPSPRRTEPDPPSADEVAALLNASWTDPGWGLLLWLTMLTGPRRGEVSALRWRHIDFERGLLWVHRSNAQTKAGLKEKSTKTAQTRKIALDEHTVKLLTDHRDRWARRCADLGTVLTLGAFVFSNHPDGSQPYAPTGDQPALPEARAQARQHPPALAPALLRDRTRRRRRRHPHRRRSARPRQRGRDDAQGLRRLGRRGGPADRQDDGRDRSEARAGAAAPRGPYETIASALREEIRSVAVGTAHRAITVLKDEGLILVARGRRAVVRGFGLETARV